MKIKPILLNISFIVYLMGLLITIGVGMQTGAIIILIASFFILAIYIIQIIHSIKKNKFWSLENLMYTIAILISAVIFIHGFSVSIAMPFLGNIPGFSSVYLASGLLLILLFLSGSIRAVNKVDNSNKRLLLITIFSIVSAASALGVLGIAGVIPVSGWLVTYSLMFLIFFFLILFAIKFFSGSKENKPESLVLVILSGMMIFFMLVRFYFPQLLPQGLINLIVSFGFVPIIILPLSLLAVKKFHFFTVFVFLFIFLDFYFIHTDRNLSYLITVGTDGCEGYEDATNYPINTDPGLAIEDLFSEPTESELNDILKEWREKDFAPRDIKIEYTEVRRNGDSLKVISHRVNGQKHYGLIRIPKGIDISKAPILLGLMGGGTGIDVLKTSDINRLSSGNCRNLLANYVSIMPAFRGNIIRGDNFCFRSEGYSGDVWLGAAEDAVAFLEAVKFMYKKTDGTKILATGVSRGATVALIIGGLTNKLDYIIANSTHTKFLDRYVVNNERVGGSYSRAFYTPKANPDEIRKRIIASSPYYFLNNLPTFEIHQGTEDQKTTVWHTRILEKRLHEIGRNDSTNHIYIYDGKGHAYDDNNIVCASLSRFFEK